MKIAIFQIIALVITTSISISQTLTQTVRGNVVDKETKITLVGATVYIPLDSGKFIGTTTDIDGNYRLANIPIGRRTIKIKLVGYKEAILSNIIIDAAKEIILNIELEESVSQMEEVVITATKKDEVNNDMASVSARSFAIEETNRYAGSRGDAGRMVSNFAGVQGGDDSRNDIVIRGNSPMGLLWRIEGVDIPNPNHFAVPGTTGGAISILNNKMFGNSDFFTGAFPAEYGNANAGVFDIRFRNGNNERHEFTGQFGFLGTELAAEGPISKKNGSTYLITYRYSTLKIFDKLHIPIGTSAVPNYQDLSFKLNFPGKNKSNISIFGVGGISTINILLSGKKPGENELYGGNNSDQRFGTSMGVIGIVHSKTISEKTFLRTTIAGYSSNAYARNDIFFRDSVTLEVDTMFPKLRYNFNTSKYIVNSAITHKINSRHSIKSGVVAEFIQLNYADSNYLENLFVWTNRMVYKGSTYLIQPYTQWKFKKTDHLTFNVGLHGLYSGMNGSISIEPRAGMRWNLKHNQALSFGFGIHSQLQPYYIYTHHIRDTTTGNYYLHNATIDVTKSMHYVLGYDKQLFSSMRLKLEAYYQYLFNVPVEKMASSFSAINQGSTFSRFFPGPLENTGIGYNYGLEATLEKFFSKNYFFMLTGSLFESKAAGKDGIIRNTDFNGNFATNALFTKEWFLNKSKTTLLTTGTKITYAGGKRYSPADLTASRWAGEIVEVDSLKNTLQFNNYFRMDLKIGIKINTKKLATHEIAVDLVNIFNTKNLLGLTYSPNPRNPSANPIQQEYQLGFLPLFYYKIDF